MEPTSEAAAMETAAAHAASVATTTAAEAYAMTGTALNVVSFLFLGFFLGAREHVAVREERAKYSAVSATTEIRLIGRLGLWLR